MSSLEHKQETDWQAIAIALGQRVNFAIQHLDGGSGFLADLSGDEPGFIHWHDYFAEGMEMLPGVKIDREILATMRLPKRQGQKARRLIKERRDAIAKANGEGV